MSVTNFLLKTLRELDRVFVCFGSQYSASVRRASLSLIKMRSETNAQTDIYDTRFVNGLRKWPYKTCSDEP